MLVRQGLKRRAMLAQGVQRKVAVPAHAEDQGDRRQQDGEGQKSFDPVHPCSVTDAAPLL
ncbi:hypothetical protein D3C75_1289510 [compost metagenome]